MVRFEPFGTFLDGRPITKYVLENKNGMQVSICNVGAAIVSVCFPQPNGSVVDVVLGLETGEDYFNQRSNFGVVVGRHAGRIGGAVFTLNGQQCRLTQNSGENHIHGGPSHFGKKLWKSEIRGDTVHLWLVSPDGEEGYPGNLVVAADYRLDDENHLYMTLSADEVETDTIINLTNHTYFNLAGHGAGNADEQLLQLHADFFAQIDEAKKPTGCILSVKGTPMDFTEMRAICQHISDEDEQILYGGGYDHNFVLRKEEREKLSTAAKLVDPVSGRYLKIDTTFPCIQLYTGNYLDGTEQGKEGVHYAYRGGVCLEVQGFTNGMEFTHFPSPILRKGDRYCHTTIYAFGVEK